MYRSRRTASAIVRKVMWARSRPVRVVAGSLLVGKLLRLGPHLFEADYRDVAAGPARRTSCTWSV